MDLDPSVEVDDEEEYQLLDHNEAKDVQALFSGSAAAAIELDADDGGDGASRGSTSPMAAAGTVADSSSNKCHRSATWKHFDELTHIVNGKRKRKEQERSGIVQYVLKYNPDGSLVRWEYSPKVARTELCHLIAREDLSLWFGECDAFQEYINNAHNPKFRLIKLYNDRVLKLIDTFKFSISSISLTSDIWNDEAHTGRNIVERISRVVDEYGLTDKIFAITLDNALPNKTAMDFLKPLFSSYLGIILPELSDDDSDECDDLSVVFLHQRCACHVINLIVKSCLTILKPYLDDFRTAIKFLNYSNQRIAAYKSYCLSMGITPRKFGVDIDVRWNSSFFMLKHLLPHREGAPPLLTNNHWSIAEKMLIFLQLFYDSTVALSGVYYPTSPLILHQILKIARHLNAYENDDLLRQAVVPMKDKFLKYWKQIPLLYAFAFILDPRAKMRGFHKVLVRLSALTGIDHSRLPQKFGNAHLNTQPQTSSVAEGKNMAWDDIYGDDDFECLPPQSGSGRRSDNTAPSPASFATRSSISELWWHQHKITYPVLSILAKDIMFVPASTISSESTFSLAGRVIEECRRQLTSDMVEVLSCIKDWELADLHMQHDVEEDTKEMEAIFESMTIEEEK
ncbi:hypothetical protein BS78_10G123300 [Paspalum vaginatum]|nr:hypothetical protein BS78_10G123300 [Paspalum vaginatum]